MYAYIDESGDTGNTKKSSKHFVLAAIVVSSENILSRIAKKIYKSKILDKNKNDQLHANKNNFKIHNAIIKELNEIDFKVFYSVEKNYLHNLEKLVFQLKENQVKIIQTKTIKEKGLQIADFISWATFGKIEIGDDYYFNKIMNLQK